MALIGPTTTDVIQKSHGEAAVSSDHTYSSPTPHPSPMIITTTNHNDHTYAEDSDIPTELYGSDSDSKTENMSTGISKEGWLMIASTDKLEISVEYSKSASLLEEIGTTQNASEMLLDASNAGIIQPSSERSSEPVLPDETANHEALLEATNTQTLLPDVTNDKLPDKPKATLKVLPDETDSRNVSLDAMKEPNEPLIDVTKQLLPDATTSKESEVNAQGSNLPSTLGETTGANIDNYH